MSDPEQDHDSDESWILKQGDDLYDTIADGAGSHKPEAAEDVPLKIGRFHVERLLGRGGFGRVFLARDEQLHRRVALKVPHAMFVSTPDDAARFLAEARAAANLDHPNIVPVYGVEQADGCCFIINKLVSGMTLSARRRVSPLSPVDAALLVARVADALDYAHEHDVYHLDVKPGNILLDKNETPHLSDFGLAAREVDLPRLKDRRAGTVPYMAPEQLLNEGHRVDGRTDIYQLGVVFYELLAGRPPFQAKSVGELIERIIESDPRPPRQRRQSAAETENLEREFERICLKAMARRMSDRYTTARDLAQDLRAAIDALPGPPPLPKSAPPGPAPGAPAVVAAPADMSALDSPSGQPSSSASSLTQVSVRVIPRGLCAFGADDKDFFLGLVAGPRDRHGVPDSIRFWQTKIESSDAAAAFAVGVLYGPSGCGKSSLVRAGLLPRLSERVRTICIEASGAETESRLLRKLKFAFGELDPLRGLAELFTEIRRGRGLAKGQKLLVVIDQFEQWLHARPDQEESELARALRQCDAERIQCLLLVREDFGVGMMRFLRNSLDVGLVQGRNFALVDLFDVPHARKVLAAFGQALGRLPENLDDLSADQRRFLDEAVGSLADSGKVIPVRLSLLAEMLKDQPWIPQTLKRLGGFQGMGVLFLEQAFGAGARNPEHRLYRRAARAILKSLLPEAGLDIKGRMTSRRELAVLAGYPESSRRLGRLFEILDGELHLVTPTEFDSPLESASGTAEPFPQEPYYQLSHDYLVAPLREWLTQEQRQTWRGRAELCLAERAVDWSRTRHHRSLPSLREYLAIVAGVRRRSSAAQSDMMRAATRRHLPRWGGVLLVAALLAFALNQWVSARQKTVETLVDRLVQSPAVDVPAALANLGPWRNAARPLLRSRLAASASDSREELHASYGLAALGEAPLERLVAAIADAPDDECANLIAALRPAGALAIERLRRRWDADADVIARSRYAIVLLYLDQIDPAREMLAFRADPLARTEFYNRFQRWHGPPQVIAERLDALGGDSAETALRSGLCLAVGGLLESEVDHAVLDRLRLTMARFYEQAPDAATHSAAGWALSRWGFPLPQILAAGERAPERQWIETPDDLTMVRIPAGSFSMGDPNPDGSPQPSVTLSRPFYMADREIPVHSMRLFLGDSEARFLIERYPHLPRLLQLDDEAPAGEIPWDCALIFCNWLSLRDGKQPCYRDADAVDESETIGKLSSASGQWLCDFSANGYRLPTEAEWEYACRAGTTTNYSFGSGERWLDRYVVHLDNSRRQPSRIVTRFPNDWGLFDMHGNLGEWCWDWFELPNASAARADPQGPARGTERVSRGGHYFAAPADCRSASRGSFVPLIRVPLAGFRIVCSAPAD